MQGELEDYRVLLQGIRYVSQSGMNTLGVIDGPYARSVRAIQNLRTHVETKLLNRKFEASGKMRRLAWVRNKSKVYVLLESLRESKQQLVMALSAAGL